MRVPLSCGLAIVMLWYGIFGPLRNEIHQLEARLAGQTPLNQTAHVAAVILPVLEREILELERALGVLQDSSESGSDSNGLIADLQLAASDTRLRIAGLKPRADLIRESNAEQAVELAIEGTYHDVGRFLGRVSSSTRVMTAPEVSLTARQDNRGMKTAAVGSVAILGFDLSAITVSDEGVHGYDSGGRRDPFDTLAPNEPSAVPAAVATGGRGLAAVQLADVVVKGIARSGQQRLAILETSARRSFIVRPLDRLADSVVHDVGSSGVTFLSQGGRGGPTQLHKPIQPASGSHP